MYGASRNFHMYCVSLDSHVFSVSLNSHMYHIDNIVLGFTALPERVMYGSLCCELK